MRVYNDEFVAGLRAGSPGVSVVEALALRQDPLVTRFRDQVEAWFADSDRNAQRALLPPLRSRVDEEFYGAFFALVMKQFLATSGWRASFQPFERDQPTFRVAAPQGEFDLEVAAVAPRSAGGRERKVQLLMSELASIEGQFVFAVHVRRWLPDDFDPTRVRLALEQWLRDLTTDDQYASRRALYLDDRIDIEFAILSKSHEARPNCIGLWLAPLDVEEHFEGLNQAAEKALVKVRGGTGAPKRPFVVALCHGDTWGMVENTVMHALYGKPRSIRARSGFGGGRRKVYDYSRRFRPAIFNRPGNEPLSAVLFVENRWHMGEIQYDMRVFHNPWAATPLPQEAFSILPQLVPAPLTNGAASPLLSWRNQQNQLVSLSDPEAA